MMSLRNILVACALVVPYFAHASDIRPYTDETFMALQSAGSPILIDIYASWCPTCRRQGRILDELLMEPAFTDVVVLKLDWDSQRESARAFGAPRQSTLIVYRGEEERGRSVADTRIGSIRKLLESAAKN